MLLIALSPGAAIKIWSLSPPLPSQPLILARGEPSGGALPHCGGRGTGTRGGREPKCLVPRSRRASLACPTAGLSPAPILPDPGTWHGASGSGGPARLRMSLQVPGGHGGRAAEAMPQEERSRNELLGEAADETAPRVARGLRRFSPVREQAAPRPAQLAGSVPWVRPRRVPSSSGSMALRGPQLLRLDGTSGSPAPLAQWRFGCCFLFPPTPTCW